MRLTSAIALCAVMLLATPSVAFARGEINIDRPDDDGKGPVIVVDRPDTPEPERPDNSEPYDEDVDDGGTDPDKTPVEPPSLSCRFEITADGKVIVVIVNKGGPMPPLTIMRVTWDAPGASSLGYFVPEEGLPAKSVYETVPLPWGWAKLDGVPCIITLEHYNPT